MFSCIRRYTLFCTWTVLLPTLGSESSESALASCPVVVRALNLKFLEYLEGTGRPKGQFQIWQW